MELIKRGDIQQMQFPSRVIQKCVGKDGFSKSEKMTMGFARYSAESGLMEPHHHAEEIVFVLDAFKGWVRYGSYKDQLGGRIALEACTTLHFKELEWHVFGFEENGYVDIIFFYGQVENIRPEEILKS